MKKKLLSILACSLLFGSLSSIPIFAAEETVIDQQVLYDENNIKITATGFRGDEIFGPEVSVLVENNSDKSITVQPRKGCVNGYMSKFQMSSDVAPGKKANDSITIMEDLEKIGVDTIAQLECSFTIFDSSTYDTIVDTEIIPIVTNLSDDYVQEYKSEGTVLFDSDGIKIVSKGIAEDEIWGPELILYIENNTNKFITVQPRDTSINGFMVNPNMSSEITPGKKIVDGLTFFSSALEENGISEISDIETSFEIFDSDTYDTIINTGALSLTF